MLKKLFEIPVQYGHREVWTYNNHRIQVTIRELDHVMSVVEVASWSHGWHEIFNYNFTDRTVEEIVDEALKRAMNFINGS